MSELRNHQHELFARAVASGRNASQAYRDAGYQKCHRQNAHRVIMRDDVRQRVEELKTQRKTDNKNGRDPETGQFLLGHKGQGGRPKGSRALLAEAFIADLCVEWETSGPTALKRVVEQDPISFCKLVGQLVPAKLDQTLNVEFGAAESLLTAFRLARQRVADFDDPILLELEREPDAVEQ